MNKKEAVEIFLKEFLNVDEEYAEKEIYDAFVFIKYDAKQMIFTEGDRADKMYYLISGAIKLSRISEDGKETIIHLVSPNEIFAAVAARKGSLYPVTATTAQQSELLGIDARTIEKISAQNPAFMTELFIYATNRIKYLLDTIDGLTSKDARGRLENYLQKLSETVAENGKVRFSLPLAKNELALLLGTTPETISRLFTKLKDEGVIEQHGVYLSYHGKQEKPPITAQNGH